MLQSLLDQLKHLRGTFCINVDLKREKVIKEQVREKPCTVKALLTVKDLLNTETGNFPATGPLQRVLQHLAASSREEQARGSLR